MTIADALRRWQGVITPMVLLEITGHVFRRPHAAVRCTQFYKVLIQHAASGPSSSGLLRQHLDCPPITTVQSWYRRAGLPSPKALLDGVRMVLVAGLLLEGFSLSEVAYALNYPDTSSFSRSVRRMSGYSPKELGWILTGATPQNLVDRFVTGLFL
jgi:AraC-like DNA-binding protein